MSEEIYTRGDWIVHASYGVGQVRGKDKKSIGGKNQTFLRVKTFSSEYFLPIKKWDVPHIRPLSSEYQFRKALTILRSTPDPLCKDYKQRNKQIAEASSDISIYTKAEILRDLNGRKRAGKLSFSETESFDKLVAQFLNEWSIVSGKEKDVLKEKLENAFGTSYQKLINTKDESWLEKVRKGVKLKRKEKNTS